MKIQIPASVDEAVDKLGALGQLLTATEWERAAILATFVEVGERGGDKSKRSSAFETPKQFAARGIVGLKSENTVARYVKAWTNVAGTRPQPGAELILVLELLTHN